MTLTIEERRERRRREQAERERLARGREETGAVEVRLHHVPVWLAKRCRKWLRVNRVPHTNYTNHMVLREFERAIHWHLDHFGTSHNGTVFVNEPYPSTRTTDDNRRAADELGLELNDSHPTWWNPGHTTRFEFRRPEGEK